MFVIKTKILITGAAGFIGQHLLKKLYNENCEIHCIVRGDASELIDNKIDSIYYYEVDLKLKEPLNKIVKNISPDIVIHLAGIKNRTNEIREINNIFDNNILGTLNLIESLLGITNLRRIILLGSIEEYGSIESPFKENNFENPISIYGVSKLSISKLAGIFVNEYKLPITILRPSIVYGPKQGIEMFIPSIIDSLSKKQSFSMTKGKQYRDFIFIDDLIQAIKKTILSDEVTGLVINIASGISYQLCDIANKIAIMLNAEDYLHIGTLEYRKQEIMNYSVDINLALAKLNWKPITSIDEGLKITINSFHE